MVYDFPLLVVDWNTFLVFFPCVRVLMIVVKKWVKKEVKTCYSWFWSLNWRTSFPAPDSYVYMLTDLTLCSVVKRWVKTKKKRDVLLIRGGESWWDLALPSIRVIFSLYRFCSVQWLWLLRAGRSLWFVPFPALSFLYHATHLSFGSSRVSEAVFSCCYFHLPRKLRLSGDTFMVVRKASGLKWQAFP